MDGILKHSYPQQTLTQAVVVVVVDTMEVLLVKGV
jgi:hypothetical protein